MSRILRPEEIAVILEQSLNTYAISYYDNTDIQDKIVFNVTADYQLYERWQKEEYEIDDNQYFTPVVIKRVDFYQYPADYLRYAETYEIEVYGYAKQLQSLETIFKGYISDENTINKSVVISPFRVTKESVDVSFGVELDSKDGSLEKRVQGQGAFTWSFLDGIKTSYDIDITIDGTSIPYIDFSFVDANRIIASKDLDTVGLTGLKSTNYYGLQLTIPYISTSTKIVEIYNDFYNGKFNKTYTIAYNDGTVSFSYEVVLQNKTFVDERPKILDYTVTFVRKEETANITIDAIELPVLSFSKSPVVQMSSKHGINEDNVQNAFIGYDYQIVMDIDISDLTNTKAQELFAAVMKNTFNVPYLIDYTKGAVAVQYNVLLKSGSYEMNTSADGKITLVFVELDSEV